MTLGTATYPGIATILGGSYTNNVGISPGVAILTTVPHTDAIAEVGDLTITFGDTKVVIKQCAIDRASLRLDQSGNRWTIRLFDRRWKWEYGHISGWYNQRNPDGSVNADFEKTPQELARLLLEEMGEIVFDVGNIPNDTRPEVNWDYSNPARELADLCDALKCRIAIDKDDNVKIWRIDQGEDLPLNTGLERTGDFGLDATVKPEDMLIVGGPLRFQSKLKLEAVGEDIDGSIKPIDELSYAPAGGFQNEYMLDVIGTYIKDGKSLNISDLAQSCVFRWYRIKEQASRPLGGGIGADDIAPPGWPFGFVQIPSKEIKRFLPLRNGLIETQLDPQGKRVPKDEVVTGIFYDFNEDETNSDDGTVYKGRWTLDRQHGIVRFSDPVYRLDVDDTYLTATLYLECSYQVKTEDGGSYFRYTKDRAVPGAVANTNELILRYPELDNTFITRYREANVVDKVEDNTKAVDAEAEHVFDQAVRQFETDQSLTVEYAGLVEWVPDGATQQVTYSFREGQPMLTTISRGTEHEVFAPNIEERRRIERAKKRDEADAMLAAGRGVVNNVVDFFKGLVR